MSHHLSILRVSALATFALSTLPLLTIVPAHAQSFPSCSSPSADPDGDGFGWENNQTCQVSASSQSNGSTGSYPACSASVSDSNGNGWGWENNQTCRFGAVRTIQAVNSPTTDDGTPVCSSASADPEGDGWGWENNQSCRVTSASASTGGTTNSAQTSSGTPVCSSTAFDSDNDGWGWENNQTCQVTSATGSGSASTPAVSPATSGTTVPATSSNGTPSCTYYSADPEGDGWGWERGETCQVTASTQQAPTNVGPAAPPPVSAATGGSQNGQPICLSDASDDGNNGFGFENGRTCVVASGVTATRDNPLLNQRSCIPWLELGYGPYRLQNNTWNEGAVYSDNWSQCIELTGGPGNYIAKWDYNWLQRHEGNDFAVKSYPQVYYGRKTRYNTSGTVAETGLPANVNGMKQFWVEYDYSETGNVERNVALESFFHTSCDAEEYNKQYELMVWVGVPKTRTPGVKLTTVNLSGQEWDVFVNPQLGWAYVAFVAAQPHTSGRLDWNAFVDWARYQGPAAGVPAMASNACMGAIEIGTETFWGSGTFTLKKFKVNH